MPPRPVSTRADHDPGPAPEGVLTVEEVARALRVNTKTVYALVKRGQLRAFRVGRVLRCRQGEVSRFILAGEANSQPERAFEE